MSGGRTCGMGWKGGGIDHGLWNRPEGSTVTACPGMRMGKAFLWATAEPSVWVADERRPQRWGVELPPRQAETRRLRPCPGRGEGRVS